MVIPAWIQPCMHFEEADKLLLCLMNLARQTGPLQGYKTLALSRALSHDGMGVVAVGLRLSSVGTQLPSAGG